MTKLFGTTCKATQFLRQLWRIWLPKIPKLLLERKLIYQLMKEPESNKNGHRQELLREKEECKLLKLQITNPKFQKANLWNLGFVIDIGLRTINVIDSDFSLS